MDIMNYTALCKREIAEIQTMAFTAPEGWIAIAGTYKGGDAMSTRIVAPDRELLVIDSFKGLSLLSNEDQCEKSMEAGSFSNGGTAQYLENFKEMGLREPEELAEMWIDEETLKAIPKREIGFLWLDLDLYTPTLACLNYFWPMMAKDGIVMTHDYGFEQTPGIEQACTEFGGKWKQVFANMYAQVNK